MRRCGADFTSLELFDRHRVGRHEPDDRRCLSVDEMSENGWQRDSRVTVTYRGALRARRSCRARPTPDEETLLPLPSGHHEGDLPVVVGHRPT